LEDDVVYLEYCTLHIKWNKRKSRCIRQLHVWLVIGSLFFLSGCLVKTWDKWFHDDTQLFSGTYDNQHNSDTLDFKNGTVSIFSSAQFWSAPYKVDGRFLFIRVRNSTKEKRPDITMRIHGDGEVLTCNSCAKYQLSNIWVKIDFNPDTSTKE